VLWILGPADGCCGSLYPMGWWIGAVDSATQWAGVHIGALPSGPADRCWGSCYQIDGLCVL